MRPKDKELAHKLGTALEAYDEKRPLLGIKGEVRKQVFIEQLIESIRRIRYVFAISTKPLSADCTDPSNELFDPIKAAVVFRNNGDFNEASWMVFLAVHFGKHGKGGWRYPRLVYGQLGSGTRWNWVNVREDPASFRLWIEEHQNDIRRSGSPGGFGNHRKYESLGGVSEKGTGAAVESYVQWVGGSHSELFQEAARRNDENPRRTFADLYKSMEDVKRFGRTARFDYLSMIGKLALANIEPDSAYLRGATGPLQGARLLFENDRTASLGPKELDPLLVELEGHLDVEFGFQALEDALCNWQKSPNQFRPFRG